MLFLGEFWARHRRKILFTAGAIGCGYLTYKLYYVHKRSLQASEKVLASQREIEELIRAQMRAHFENIQMIADTLTLPHAIQNVREQIAKELDLSHLTDKLQKARGHPSMLTASEKYDLWNRLKILSFTRLVSSMWTSTLISLYTRVQVNILGRHLYLHTARFLDTGSVFDGVENVDRVYQQRFLASPCVLPNAGLPIFIHNIQAATFEALHGKQLGDILSTNDLTKIIMQIVSMPMSLDMSNQWFILLIPSQAEECQNPSTTNDNNSDPSDQKIFDQLMAETHAVLSSTEFRDIVEISMKSVMNAIVEEFELQLGKSNLASGIRLATLLPKVAAMCELCLECPSTNRFVQLLHNLPEVEQFFTVLYSSMPIS